MWNIRWPLPTQFLCSFQHIFVGSAALQYFHGRSFSPILFAPIEKDFSPYQTYILRKNPKTTRRVAYKYPYISFKIVAFLKGYFDSLLAFRIIFFKCCSVHARSNCYLTETWNLKFWCNQGLSRGGQLHRDLLRKALVHDVPVTWLQCHKVRGSPQPSTSRCSCQMWGWSWSACFTECLQTEDECPFPLHSLPNTLPAMQQSNSWSGCLAGKQASSALKQTVWKPAMGSATAWHYLTGSWSSLVPRIILKWRLLSWEMVQQNQQHYQLHHTRRKPKDFTHADIFWWEKKNLDGKWLSDLTLQPIFTVRTSAWLSLHYLLLECWNGAALP